MAIRLITDSACDLPLDYIEANKIEIIPLEINIKGDFIKDDLGQTLKYKEFYDLLRAGEAVSTSQINIHTFEETFEKHVKNGDEVLYIGFSLALSGTVNSAKAARKHLLEQYPEANITIIDSNSASIGEGLLVHEASERLKKGASKQEVIDWIEDNKNHVIHVITVDDLEFLKKSGRVSGGLAMIGGLLNIKPILKVNEEGNIVPISKVKGRKKVLRYLANVVKEKAEQDRESAICIAHADCLEDAEILKQMILEENPEKIVQIGYVGAPIGAHTGPNSMGVMFFGKER